MEEASDVKVAPEPHCLVCGTRMTCARRIPKLGAAPELVSYECRRCGHVVTHPEGPLT